MPMIDDAARPGVPDAGAMSSTSAGEPALVRPRSRAERMAHPLTLQAIKELAAKHGVCIRPVGLRRTDLATGQTEVFDVRCGATREKKCPVVREAGETGPGAAVPGGVAPRRRTATATGGQRGTGGAA